MKSGEKLKLVPTRISRGCSAQPLEPLKARTDNALKAGGALELGIVLDQSSSMSTLVNEALAAFNTCVDDQRNVKCGSQQGNCFESSAL